MLFRSTTVVQGFPAVNSFYTESPETPRDFPSFPDTDPQGEGGISTPSGITFPPPQLVPQGEGGVTPSGFLPPFPVLREVSGLSSYTCISKVQKLLSIGCFCEPFRNPLHSSFLDCFFLYTYSFFLLLVPSTL